jgi:hypothetical protein
MSPAPLLTRTLGHCLVRQRTEFLMFAPLLLAYGAKVAGAGKHPFQASIC